MRIIGPRTEVTLNTFEQATMKSLAEEICKQKREVFDKQYKVDTRSLYEVSLQGFSGELAFCKMVNIYPWCLSADINYTGPDCFICGRKIDVKTTKYETGQLIIPPHKINHEAELFVLMIGEKVKFSFRGWIWAKEILREERLKPHLLKATGKIHKSYTASQSVLRHALYSEDLKGVANGNQEERQRLQGTPLQQGAERPGKSNTEAGKQSEGPINS